MEKSRSSFKTVVYPARNHTEKYNTQYERWDTLSNNAYSVTITEGRYNRITYSTCKVGKDGFRPTQFCEHVDNTFAYKAQYARHYLNLDHTQRRTLTNWYGGFDLAFLSALPYIPSLSTSHNSGYDFIAAGCVDKEFSLPVMGIELPETKDILRTFRKLWEKPKKINNPREAANLHLTWSFGIKPLVSDILASISTITSLHKHILWLRKNEGKFVPVRYRADLSKYGPVSRVVLPLDDSPWEHVENYSALYSAFARVKYNTKALNDYELGLRSLIRSFGVDNPLDIIWERIPFSFILDWFTDLSSLVRSIPPKVVLPRVIQDVGHSIKVTYGAKLYDMNFPAYNVYANAYSLVGEINRKYYRRERGLPLSYSGMNFGLPGYSQLALGASLAIQRT